MDLTIAEIAAKIAATDPLKAWWTAAAALPADTSVAEFFGKTLKAAHLAALEKNAGLNAGSRIDGYPAPTYSATTLNAGTGIESQIVTATVRARVPLNPDASISPLA